MPKYSEGITGEQRNSTINPIGWSELTYLEFTSNCCYDNWTYKYVLSKIYNLATSGTPSKLQNSSMQYKFLRLY